MNAAGTIKYKLADPLWLLDCLKGFGFHADPQQSIASQLEQVLLLYQQWHGLPTTGALNAATIRHVAAPRLCAHPDMVTDPSLLRWANKTRFAVGMDQHVSFGTLPRPAAIEATESAWDAITTAVNLHAITCDASQAAADIWILTQDIDGPWGLLGITDFPDPYQPQQRTIRLDHKESWTLSAFDKWHINLRSVLLHETLHALGIGHGPAGSIMAAVYDNDVRTLSAWDRQELQKRYPIA